MEGRAKVKLFLAQVKMKYFKLKQKPKKPKRREIIEYYSLYEGQNLKDIFDNFTSMGLSFEEIKFKSFINHNCYTANSCYCTPENSLIFKRMQSDAEYQEDLDIYNKKLQEYETWFEKNKENIENYNKKKEDTAKQRKLKKIAGMAKVLKKQKKI